MTSLGVNRNRAALFVLCVAFLAGPLSGLAAAQERPVLAAEAAAGWVGFVADGIQGEPLFGGSARFYLLPRMSLGPEIAYILGDGHYHLMMTANLAYDYPPEVNNRPRRIVPFVIAGAGLLYTRGNFPTRTFTSTVGAFTAGGGVRLVSADRVTAGIDLRIGWHRELHMRVGGTVGVQLGR